MKKIGILIGIALCLTLSVLTIGCRVLAENSASGDDTTINEDALFSDSNTEVKQEDVVKDNVTEELEKRKIGFSGVMGASSTYNQYADGTNDFINDLETDLFIDARLEKGFKGFISGTIDYNSSKDQTTASLKECFMDANINNKVYFRIGKQVLKWGQGYFWNPTDLINIEPKDFTDLNKLREGTFGLKVQMPSGVQRNLYLFADLYQVKKLKDMSLAAKYEFLVKNTEMSFSTRLKDGDYPYYGFDITGRLFKCDFRGEISLTDGANYNDKVLNYDTLAVKNFDGQLISRLSIGFTKTFDQGDIKERISITPEFYFNPIGYDQNIIYRVKDDSAARNYLLNPNRYEPWGNYKYYLAVFSSISKFIISDMTLNINGIMNLVDHSGTLMGGISYKPALTNWDFNLNLKGNLGDEYTEATFTKNTWSLGIGAKLSF